MENKLLGQKKNKFGLYEASLATLLFLIYNTIFSFLYAFIPDSFTENIMVASIANILLESTFVLTALTVACTRKINIKKATNVEKKINKRMVWLCFLISLVSIVGFGDITNLFIEFLYALGYRSILPSMAITSFAEYLLYVVVSCVTPALCEEFLFRGTILSGLKEYSIKIAVIVSALIFTFMHGNAEQTVHQFIVGVVIGYVFYKSGNFWLGVIIHFFNNFIAVTASYLMTFISAETTDVVEEVAVQVDAFSIVISIVSTILFVWAGYYFIKILIDKLLKENEKVNGEIQEDLNLQSITVDGKEQTVEMVIEGEVVEKSEKSTQIKKTSQMMPMSVIVMFTIAGLIMFGNWLLALISGFGG